MCEFLICAKKMRVPKFKNEAEEAAWWEAHRPDTEAEIRRRMRLKEVSLRAGLPARGEMRTRAGGPGTSEPSA
jgi:hypothetical protein